MQPYSIRRSPIAVLCRVVVLGALGIGSPCLTSSAQTRREQVPTEWWIRCPSRPDQGRQPRRTLGIGDQPVETVRAQDALLRDAQTWAERSPGNPEKVIELVNATWTCDRERASTLVAIAACRLRRGDKLYEAFNNLKPAQQRYPRAFCRRLGIEIEPFINSWVDGKVEAARALCKTGEYEKALELSQMIRRIGVKGTIGASFIQGMVACHKKDPQEATRAFRRLDAAHRYQLIDICQIHGLKLIERNSGIAAPIFQSQ